MKSVSESGFYCRRFSFPAHFSPSFLVRFILSPSHLSPFPSTPPACSSILPRSDWFPPRLPPKSAEMRTHSIRSATPPTSIPPASRVEARPTVEYNRCIVRDAAAHLSPKRGNWRRTGTAAAPTHLWNSITILIHCTTLGRKLLCSQASLPSRRENRPDFQESY